MKCNVVFQVGDDFGVCSVQESVLMVLVGKLMVLVEDYFDFKVNENFKELQIELLIMENKIEMVWCFYNGVVCEMNVVVESFFGNLIVGVFGFICCYFFEIQMFDWVVFDIDFGGLS